MKTADQVEILAMLGLFGSIVGGIQISVLEREEFKSIHWSSGAVPLSLSVHTNTLCMRTCVCACNAFGEPHLVLKCQNGWVGYHVRCFHMLDLQQQCFYFTQVCHCC
ncbi:hypothetical protein R6Q59_030570 [Mikania micrantha]